MNQGDPMWPVKVQALNSRMLTDQLQRMAAYSTLATKNQETAAFTRDLPKLNAMIQALSKDPTAAVDVPLESAQGARLSVQIQRQASSGALAKSLAQGRTDYDRRLAKVVSTDPEVGSDLALPAGQYPSAMNFQSLSLAEQRVQIRAENKAKEAEIEALKRGDVPTTSIAGNKVTTTYRPMPPQTPVGTDIVDLGNGEALFRNPKSGHFVIRKMGGEEKQMTKGQLLAVAKAISETDPANAKRINDYVANAATNQIAPKPATEATPAPKASEDTSDFDDWFKKKYGTGQ